MRKAKEVKQLRRYLRKLKGSGSTLAPGIFVRRDRRPTKQQVKENMAADMILHLVQTCWQFVKHVKNVDKIYDEYNEAIELFLTDPEASLMKMEQVSMRREQERERFLSIEKDVRTIVSRQNEILRDVQLPENLGEQDSEVSEETTVTDPSPRVESLYSRSESSARGQSKCNLNLPTSHSAKNTPDPNSAQIATNPNLNRNVPHLNSIQNTPNQSWAQDAPHPNSDQNATHPHLELFGCKTENNLPVTTDEASFALQNLRDCIKQKEAEITGLKNKLREMKSKAEQERQHLERINYSACRRTALEVIGSIIQHIYVEPESMHLHESIDAILSSGNLTVYT